jgi:hypothetical protein
LVDYRAIMSLALKGRTYLEITASVGCSHRDVSAVKKALDTVGITAERFASMTAADIEQLFPDGRKAVSQDYADPHFAQVVEEMKHNRFFALQQGWVKYLGASSVRKKYGYSQYCEMFNRFAAATDVVAPLKHEPGKAMFVD